VLNCFLVPVYWKCLTHYLPGTRDSGDSLETNNLKQDYLTRKTGRMWPLWIAWQHDTETAAGKLERYSTPKDLAVRGECSRTDVYIYVCLFVFTLILLHMKWHIFVYVLTPDTSSNHVYIRTYSKFYLCTYEYICLYIHINYPHDYVHLSSYLHIIFHLYTSYTSASLKWLALWIFRNVGVFGYFGQNFGIRDAEHHKIATLTQPPSQSFSGGRRTNFWRRSQDQFSRQKSRAFFWRAFFWRGITAREVCSRAVMLARF